MPQIALTTEELQPGVLPPICMICGEPKRRSVFHDFTWSPALNHGLILIVRLLIWPLLLVRIGRPRVMTACVPLCARHETYWFKRRLALPLGVGLSFFSLVVVMFGFNEDGMAPPYWMLLIPFVLLLGSGAFAAWLSLQGTRVIRITEREITFVEVHSRFVSAVEAGREEQKRKMAQWLGRHDSGP